MMAIQPVTLKGKVVQLVPLSEAHVPDLYLAGKDESIWKYMRYGQIRTEVQMGAWVYELMEAQTRSTDLPFAVIHLGTGRAIGATRYMEIQPHNRALEIGGTWYAVEYQRTPVNTECKYLLLRYAFEVLGCVRVQFKTDLRNERSQQALVRIGAIKEGVLRNHMILPDGTLRTSVFYSIIEPEWPDVKARLEKKLGY